MIGPIGYIGGKNRLATKIIRMLPPHTTYVEPFAGGAQVLFHKEPSPVEVVNDLDNEVVNFFRVCQHHFEELVRHLRYCVMSRTWYGLLAKTDPSGLTDIQRASRFFYLQKNSFGGLVVKRTYHFHVTHRPNFTPARIARVLERVHERLQGVQIECLPYEEVLKRFDRPTTVFFLDPPYWGRKLYHFNFTREDFIALERRLAILKGKFILSLNDVPEVRALFRSYRIVQTSIKYTAKTDATVAHPELLITNYKT